MILGTIYWDMLLLADAQGHLETALAVAHESHSVIWLGCIAGYLTSTLVRRGKLAEAETALNEMWTPELPMLSHGQRQLWCGRAELALARREAKEALQIVEQLIASDLQVGVRGEYAVPRLASLRGIALTMLGRYADAEATLQAASALAQDALPSLWRLQHALGNSYRRQNRRDEADQVYAVARELLAQLANTLPDDELRSRFVTQTNAQFPTPTEKQAVKQAFAGLTAKERAVATLIAQGQSNKEIAEVMVISHRTVESHVSNLLSKLHLTSRAQIAIWALEKGLGKS
jgi:DNA-binding NarL/FixJ family response regulator